MFASLPNSINGFIRVIDAFTIKFVSLILDNSKNNPTRVIIPLTIVFVTTPIDLPYISRWVCGGFQGQSSDSIPNGTVRKRAGNTHERA